MGWGNMDGTIKKLNFKVILFIFSFLFSLACFASNRQIIAGPGSGLDFMTNGENKRLSFDATGDIMATGDISAIGDLTLVGNTNQTGTVDIVGAVGITGVVSATGDQNIIGNVDVTGTIDLSGTLTGATADITELRLGDDGLTDYVTIRSTAASASYTLWLPAANCALNEILQWDANQKPQCQAPASGVGGSGTAGQVATWSASSILTGSPNYVFDGSSLQITGDITYSGNLVASGDTREAKFYQVEASGVGAGGAGLDTIQARELNASYPLDDGDTDDEWFDLNESTDRVVLSAGLYEISFGASAYEVQRHSTHLKFDVDSPYYRTDCIGTGNSEDSAAVQMGESSCGGCVIEFGASTDFSLMHYTQSAKATTGLGIPVSSGQNEVFAWIFIRKLR